MAIRSGKLGWGIFLLDDCSVLPMPKRSIPLVCAGQSPLGEFVAVMPITNLSLPVRKI
ncbi:MAG: hypothetical protein CM15mP92_2480 [Halieaceae bacterium]|nr:MAG: hypothetical protein CM15mP92_2480 [Halieaceae bacterium]